MVRIFFLLTFVLGAVAHVSAQDATFDAFSEGLIGPTFTEGGITFSNLDCNLGAATYNFTADTANADFAGYAEFTSPNCLGFINFTPGSFSGFGRVLRFDMTPAQIATEGRLQVFHLPMHPGNTISLVALLGGTVVATDTFTITAGGIQHRTFMVSGVPFDKLRLEGGGPSANGVFFASVDSVHISTPSGIVLCAGDGSGTACPCGNASPLGGGEGCLSSLGVGGRMVATGIPSLANDSVVLHGAQMPNSSALYFQGTSAQAGGAGTVFGDGLRCVGGSVVRLGTKSNQNGASQYPAAGDPSLSVRGQVGAPGVRVYQTWYRNAAGFCTPSTFNLTNGLQVTWGP